jgi:hypothetical protein
MARRTSETVSFAAVPITSSVAGLITCEWSESLEVAIGHMYGADPATSPDFSRIINTRHAQRLAGLVDAGTVVTGGQVDIEERCVAPRRISTKPSR